MLLHEQRRFPNASQMLALHGTFIGVLIRFESPSGLPQKLDFFDAKRQARWALFLYKSEAKKTTKKNFLDPK